MKTTETKPTMKPWTRIGIFVHLLGILLAILDATNILLVCRAWNEGGTLIISEIEPEYREDCQVVRRPALVAQPTFWANFLESFRGNGHLIRSAKKVLVDSGQLAEEDLERAQLSHRVLFTPGGYRIEFTLTELREEQSLAHGYGRTCGEDEKFIHKEVFLGTCQDLEEEVETRINTLADHPERGLLFSHEAQIDYQESKAYLMITYCQSKEVFL